MPVDSTSRTARSRFSAVAVFMLLVSTMVLAVNSPTARALPTDCSRGVNLSFEEPVIGGNNP